MNRGRFLLMIGFFSNVLLVGNAHALEKTVAQNGARVTINYTLTVENKVVDSSAGGKPLTYVQGSGQIVPGLEEQIKGLQQGDKRRIIVSPVKGYGQVDPEAYQNVPKTSFKNGKKLKIGQVVNGQYAGNPVRATIIGMDKKNFVLDLNHPL